MSLFEGLKKAVPKLWTDKAKITGTKKVIKNHITNSVETTIFWLLLTSRASNGKG